MKPSRWEIAAAFTKAAAALRVTHLARASMLDRAGGVEGLPLYMKEADDESVPCREMYRLYSDCLSSFKAECAARKPEESGVTAVTDKDYPARLLQIDQAPAVLFWRGTGLDALQGDFVVTVIGSRTPSFYGLEVTRRLCGQLVGRGVTIVSGGARGIDGQAHMSALAAGGPTFAVLGCGVDIVYPKEHHRLFDQIARSGAILSEYYPGTPPRRHHFPARNRILAGLSDAVLVTEASASSGTLITAGFAADQGRDVCAVPGSILSGTSRSCHDLIRDGAVIVERADDIPRIPAERHETADMIPGDNHAENAAVLRKGYSDSDSRGKAGGHEARILNILEAAPLTLAAIAANSGLSLRTAALSLAVLQSKKLVCLHRGLYTRTFNR